LLGVFVEAEQPGIVLDAFGINGARLRTLLAWDGIQWTAHLAQRSASLVVLSYGTNEVGDATKIEDYRADYAEVVARTRHAGAACLLIGPTDRQDKAGATLERAGQLDTRLEQWSS